MIRIIFWFRYQNQPDCNFGENNFYTSPLSLFFQQNYLGIKNHLKMSQSTLISRNIQTMSLQKGRRIFSTIPPPFVPRKESPPFCAIVYHIVSWPTILDSRISVDAQLWTCTVGCNTSRNRGSVIAAKPRREARPPTRQSKILLFIPIRLTAIA